MKIPRVLFAAVVLLLSRWSGIGSPAFGQEFYESDPEGRNPTLHVQPAPAPAGLRRPEPMAPSSVINGITYVDVMSASGFDIGGADYGNEPAITANPLNPSQIVITSFSGSNWASDGNSSLFYSSDAGTTWSYNLAVPPPPGRTTNISCPCDQNMDWGRNGVLYGTFLHYNVGATVQTVVSAESTNPTNPASWVYRTPLGVAQPTNLSSLIYVDQPWIWSGPLPGDNSQTNVSVAYDNFDSGFSFSEIRGADSPGASPLDFSRDAAENVDGQQYNDGMNPGTRTAVGPDGKIYTVFQRLVSVETGGVKKLTYLVTMSVDGGQTWSVANSDHASGAKIVAADVYSFQGNGSKIGGVNALLGGVDAITVDRAGTVWVVYGTRATLTGTDQLYMVPITQIAGSLTVGTPRLLTSATFNNYLPAIAVLPNGEVGTLFLTLNPTTSQFAWRFSQWTNGAAIAKTTAFPGFTSPFASSGATNQRIFGDYIQVRAVGCTFYGTFPARGAGVNSVNSIDPYFMSAPSQNACSLPTLTAIVPPATCAGSPGFSLALQGTGFSNGATGRAQGALRTTGFVSTTQVNVAVRSADIAAPGIVNVDLLGAMPGGGLTGSLPLTVETLAASPGGTLRASPNGGVNVGLGWNAAARATSYSVRRCNATAGPCTPTAIATPATNSYDDGVLLDGNNYWYLIDAVNSCGSVP